MVDMLSFLDLDTNAAKPPAELPDGVYPITVMSWKVTPHRFEVGQGTVTFECRPDALPEGVEMGSFDPTKRRIFKEFSVNPNNVDSYFYLNLFIDSLGVVRGTRRPKEYLPEAVGMTGWLALAKKSYTKRDTGELKEYTDVKFMVGDKPITERRMD